MGGPLFINTCFSKDPGVHITQIISFPLWHLHLSVDLSFSTELNIKMNHGMNQHYWKDKSQGQIKVGWERRGNLSRWVTEERMSLVELSDKAQDAYVSEKQ